VSQSTAQLSGTKEKVFLLVCERGREKERSNPIGNPYPLGLIHFAIH